MSVFDSEYPKTKGFLDANFLAFKELNSSAACEHLYSIILVIGNYFNSQKRGITYAFQVPSLIRLQHFKSKNFPGVNLLHCVAHIVLNHFGNHTDAMAGLYEKVKFGHVVDFSEINQKIKELKDLTELSKTEADKRAIAQNM